jgi:hypothetical protein
VGLLAWAIALHFGEDGMPAAASGPAALTGVRTSVLRHDRLWLRVSADEVKVVRPRIIGPFRIGFLRSVSARNVALEAFDDDGAKRSPESAVDMSQALTQLVPERLRKGVVGAELSRVKLIQHRPGQPALTVEAEACRVGLASEVVCRNGRIVDDKTVAFREASYDGRVWTVTDARRRDE